MTTPASEPVVLTIQAGATFRHEFAYTEPSEADPEVQVPRPIGDLRARMQVRKSHKATAAVLSLVDERVTPGGGLTVEPDGATGEVHVRIGANLTAALRIEDGVFDLELYDPDDPSEVDRMVSGFVLVDPEVTR